MNFKINHLQHIGIPVTDIKRSEAFYNKLGFKNVMASTFEFNGAQGTVAMMQRDDMIIEIYQMPEKELSEIRNRKDGRIDHIAFDVDDVDIAFKQLKEEGFHLHEEQPVFLAFWKKGCRFFNIAGPDGERIEFNQIIK
ncbi:MAG: VOC family protein [Bacteroidota bacterium]